MMAALLRLPGRRIAGVAAAGILSISAYFVDYRFLGRAGPGYFLSHPFYAIWFTLVYLGCPASYVNVRLGGSGGAGRAIAGCCGRNHRDPPAPDRDARLWWRRASVCSLPAARWMTAYGRNGARDCDRRGLALRAICHVSLAYWAFLQFLARWVMMRLPKRPAPRAASGRG